MVWLNKYERHARLVPGLLALLPIPITITALGLRNAPVVTLLFSVAAAWGGPLLVADTVRQLGLKVQANLWDKWGGTPTTRSLRLRESTGNVVERDIWRTAVEQFGNVPLASASSESSDPVRADAIIEVAVGRVRELTRDEKAFPLIWAENRSYGFARNLYAIRGWAVVIAVLCVLLVVGVLTLVDNHGVAAVSEYWLGLAANICILLLWLTLPSEHRVRTNADRYAYQLLQGAVTLAQKRSRSRRAS